MRVAGLVLRLVLGLGLALVAGNGSVWLRYAIAVLTAARQGSLPKSWYRWASVRFRSMSAKVSPCTLMAEGASLSLIKLPSASSPYRSDPAAPRPLGRS